MDNDVSQLFVRRFGVGIDLAMPNVDATYIRTLLEEGSYKEACERLIDYYGENSVAALNEKIHSLREKLASVESEKRDLRQSNDAEHREKVQFWEKAEQAARLLKEFVDAVGKSEYHPGLIVRANEFLDKNKDLLP